MRIQPPAVQAAIELLPQVASWLDEQGLIRAVNRPWRQLMAAAAPRLQAAGLNRTLEAVARESGLSWLAQLAARLDGLLDGQADTVREEVREAAADQVRWFQHSLTACGGGALVQRLDITGAVEGQLCRELCERLGALASTCTSREAYLGELLGAALAPLQATAALAWHLVREDSQLSAYAVRGVEATPERVERVPVSDGDSLVRAAWLAGVPIFRSPLDAREQATLLALGVEVGAVRSVLHLPFGARGPGSGALTFYRTEAAPPPPAIVELLSGGLSPQAERSGAAIPDATEVAVAQAARSDSTVLLQGETGVGKTWLARRIHSQSARAAQPFVELNCAGLSPELMESELFGHERGSFTSAATRKLGLFEVANGGTVFLDEVGELHPVVQAKLLKALETRRVRRVGGTSGVDVDFRLIAATNRDLRAESEAGRFRTDLYYRLQVLDIRVMPLRERPWDVPHIIDTLLDDVRASTKLPTVVLHASALPLLVGYPWPGNVRELRNVLERAAVRSGGAIEAADVRASLPADSAPQAPGAPVAAVAPASAGSGWTQAQTLKDLERGAIELAWSQSDRVVSVAARWLGISRATLREKLKRYGVDAPAVAGDPDEQG